MENSKKNITTIVVGSILVMLALIVFLITNWHTMDSIIKLGIMALFEVFFLGFSKLLKDKYQLKGIGDTLYYIGLVYLPILLVLISILGLLGDYLSIYGQGKYIYLTLASIASAGVYYVVSKKQNVEVMLYLSIIFQVLAVICFGNIFELSYLKINCLLLLYNAFLLYFNNNKVVNYMSITLLVVLVYETIIYNANLWSCVLSWTLLFANFVIAKIKENNIVYDYCINITLFRTLYLIVFGKLLLSMDLMYCQILTMLGITLIILVINTFIKDKDFIKATSVISSLAAIILYGAVSELPVYFTDLFICLVLFYNYRQTNINVYKYGLYFFIMILISNLAKDLLGIVEIQRIIPSLVTMCIMGYYIYKNKELKTVDKVVFALFEVLSLYALRYKESLPLVIVAVIFTGATIFFNRKKDINHYYDLIPLVLLFSCINTFEVYTQAIITGIVALGTYYLQYKEEKTHSYEISSFMYTFYLGNILSKELAINSILYLLLILWSYINVVTSTNNTSKGIYKSLLAIFITILYYDIVEYFALNTYTFINLAGYIIAGLYIIRCVLAKINTVEAKDINLIEYVLFGVVYFFAISMYTSAYDGLLFTLAIFVLTMVGYYIKDEAMFMVSLIALVINALDLTREFWLAIPWWIYLLIIGGLLIMSAIINEINQTRTDNKITIKNIVNNIKKNFK